MTNGRSTCRAEYSPPCGGPDRAWAGVPGPAECGRHGTCAILGGAIDDERAAPAAELLAGAVVVSLPMRTWFRGITAREVMLRGPAGWGEFAPFTEYGDAESSAWLAAGIEAAYLGPPAPLRDRIPVNATVPAVPADHVAAVLARYPGATTAKVKVAEPGQSPGRRRRAGRRPRGGAAVRIDANGGWSVDEAVSAIAAIGDVEYVEQPCRTVEELAQVRRRVDVPIAADESIRKADDPMRVVAADAADIAILKIARSAGCGRC